jgi:hypothetical protein
MRFGKRKIFHFLFLASLLTFPVYHVQAVPGAGITGSGSAVGPAVSAAANNYYQNCMSAGGKTSEECTKEAQDRYNTQTSVGDSPMDGALAQIATWTLQLVYAVSVGLGTAVAWLASMFLSITVHFSLDSSVYGLDFLTQGWTVIRDLANMTFIFIILYLAFTVMFEANTADTMRRLVRVILIALVINFSFFATRVVIDAGNLLSVQFYNAITDGSEKLNLFGMGSLQIPDITSKIMSGIGFQSAINADTFSKLVEGKTADWGQLGGTFISFLFLFIAFGFMMVMLAGAFFAAGWKFLLRIISLWLAIVVAPLALVAWSFEKGGHGGGHGGGYFAQWRTMLISNAFYPALFLFILLLISNFMQSSKEGGFGGGFLEAALSPGNNVGLGAIVVIIANIAVKMGVLFAMLYFALEASKYFDKQIQGASWANRAGNNTAFGGLAGLLRLGVGGGSRIISNSRFAKEGSPLRAFSPLTRASFDVRRLPGASRLDLGEPGGEGGFAGDMRRFRESRQGSDEKNLVSRAIQYPGGLNEHDKEHLAHVSPETLAKFNPKDLETLGKLVKEDLVKKAEGSAVLSAAAKEALRSGWKGGASDSPTGKVSEEAALLRELIGKNSEMMWASNTKFEKVITELRKTNKLDLDKGQRLQQAFREGLRATSEELKDLRKGLRTAEGNHDNIMNNSSSTPTMIAKAKTDLNNAQQAYLKANNEQRSAAEGLKHMNEIVSVLQREKSKSIEIK